MLCVSCTLNTNEVILHYSELGAHFTAYHLQIIHITSFCCHLAPLLAKPFFPAASQSSFPSFGLTRSWLCYLPGRLKVKRVRRGRTQCVHGEAPCWPSVFFKALLCFNYRPALFWEAHAVLSCVYLISFAMFYVTRGVILLYFLLLLLI